MHLQAAVCTTVLAPASCSVSCLCKLQMVLQSCTCKLQCVVHLQAAVCTTVLAPASCSVSGICKLQMVLQFVHLQAAAWRPSASCRLYYSSGTCRLQCVGCLQAADCIAVQAPASCSVSGIWKLQWVAWCVAKSKLRWMRRPCVACVYRLFSTPKLS